jgi:hypothetical protein
VTVLVSDCNNYAYDSAAPYTNQYTVGVYLITAPGILEFQGAITGLTHTLQSIAFGWNSGLGAGLGSGAGAYDVAIGQIYENDRLFIVDVLSPGVVEIDPLRSVDLLHTTTSQLFGVDGVTVYQGNAYATYPNLTIDSELYPERYVSIVDLNSLDLTQIDWGLAETHTPVGIAGIPFTQLFLPTILR